MSGRHRRRLPRRPRCSSLRVPSLNRTQAVAVLAVIAAVLSLIGQLMEAR